MAIDAGPTPKEFGIYHGRLQRFLDKNYYPECNITSRIVRACSVSGTFRVEAFAVPPGSAPFTFAQAVVAPFRPVDIATEAFGPSWSLHWLRISVDARAAGWDVPPGRTMLEFRSGAEGLVYTSAGEPVQGTSGDRARFPLATVAPGMAEWDAQPLVFYVELECLGIAGNAPGGNAIAPPSADRFFRVESLRLLDIDEDVAAVYEDMCLLQEIVADCGEDGAAAGKQALHVANDVVNAFLAGDVPRCRFLCDSFFGHRSTSDPLAHAQSDFDDGGSLAPTIYATGHCHIDTAWLWRTTHTRRKTARSWSSQLALAKNHPAFVFAFSQAQQMQWLRDDYPSLWQRIAKVSSIDGGECVPNAAEPKPFAPLSGAWVEMDGNLPDGESLARQMLRGQALFAAEFGRPSEIFWLPDTFGYTAQLPQICRLAGMRYFVTIKLSWNQINRIPHSSFWWVSPDGSRVLAHFPPAGTYTSNVSVSDVRRTVRENKDRDRTGAAMLLYGQGDGGGGPSEHDIARLERLAAARGRVPGLPAVRMASPSDFFARLERDNATRPLLSWSGELYFELHRGTYTSQAKTKRLNRALERGLRDAELACVFKSLRSPECTASGVLDGAWQVLLLNQFHDILPGSSISDVYSDAEAAYAEALERVSELCASTIASLSTESAEDAFGVLNATAHSRTAVVQHPRTGGLVLLRDIPPLSFVSSKAHAHAPTAEVGVCASETPGGGFVLENSVLVVRLDGKGNFASVWDKRACREIVDSAGEVTSGLGSRRIANGLYLYHDVPHFWDAWDVELYVTESGVCLTDGTNRETTVSLALLPMNGNEPALRRTVVRTVTHGRTVIRQEISLDACARRVDLGFTVDWRETHKLLRIAFPLLMRTHEAIYAAPFALVRRPTHQNTTWDVARFEACGHGMAALAEPAHGVAVVSDCKYGYAVRGGTIELSLLRAPRMPDARCDIGVHAFQVSLLSFPCIPENGEPSLLGLPLAIAETAAVRHPLVLAAQGPAQAVCPIALAGGLAVEATKLAEDGTGDVIVRACEPVGNRGISCLVLDAALAPRVRSVIPSDILERPIGDALAATFDGTYSVPFTPFQIVTLRLCLT